MPRGDGTGPGGMGPRTGRGLGFCAGFAVPGFAHPGPGYRMGFGRGFGGGGRGWRNAFWATGLPGWMRGDAPAAYAPPTDDEAEMLKRQAEGLENSLKQVQSRLAEIEKQPEG